MTQLTLRDKIKEALDREPVYLSMTEESYNLLCDSAEMCGEKFQCAESVDCIPTRECLVENFRDMTRDFIRESHWLETPLPECLRVLSHFDKDFNRIYSHFCEMQGENHNAEVLAAIC